MSHEQHTKQRTLTIRNLEIADTPGELAEGEAQQVAGGLFNFDGILGDKYAAYVHNQSDLEFVLQANTKGDPATLQAR